jgi:hypothetical protein
MLSTELGEVFEAALSDSRPASKWDPHGFHEEFELTMSGMPGIMRRDE